MKTVLLVSVFLLLSACVSKPAIIRDTLGHFETGSEAVYIVSHGWHTGFVIPTKTMAKDVPELKKRFGDVPYIELGWGDKGFYQAQEITTGLTLRAIFWPTESVIHAVAVPKNVEHYFRESDVEKICLSKRNYLALIQFISNSFYRTNTGEIFPTKVGIYGDSQFYKGVGNYHLMNTCNKWTAKGLKSAGMDLLTPFKLSAGSVMRYLAKYRLAQGNPFLGVSAACG